MGWARRVSSSSGNEERKSLKDLSVPADRIFSFRLSILAQKFSDLISLPFSKYKWRSLTSQSSRCALWARCQSSSDLPCTNSAPSSMWIAAAGFLQVKIRPPIRSRASITMTLQPATLRSRAAARPAAPAPIIRTSQLLFLRLGRLVAVTIFLICWLLQIEQLNPTQVTSALERSLEPDVHDLEGDLLRNHTLSQ